MIKKFDEYLKKYEAITNYGKVQPENSDDEQDKIDELLNKLDDEREELYTKAMYLCQCDMIDSIELAEQELVHNKGTKKAKELFKKLKSVEKQIDKLEKQLK